MASALTTPGCGRAALAQKSALATRRLLPGTAGAALLAAPLTSSLRMRPPRPEPCTSAAEMPFSAMILRAAGMAVAGVAAGAAAGAAAGLAAAGAAAAGLGLGIDPGDDFAGGHGLAVLLDDLDDHAGIRRRQFEHDLVGFDVDQVLVAGDGIALLDVPGRQRGFGHRFGQLGDFDFDDHDFSVIP
jgi:predicted RNA-binding protein